MARKALPASHDRPWRLENWDLTHKLGNNDLLRAYEISLYLRILIFEQHLDYLLQVLPQLVQRLALRVSATKARYITNKESCIPILFNDGGVGLHTSIFNLPIDFVPRLFGAPDTIHFPYHSSDRVVEIPRVVSIDLCPPLLRPMIAQTEHKNRNSSRRSPASSGGWKGKSSVKDLVRPEEQRTPETSLLTLSPEPPTIVHGEPLMSIGNRQVRTSSCSVQAFSAAFSRFHASLTALNAS